MWGTGAGSVKNIGFLHVADFFFSGTPREAVQRLAKMPEEFRKKIFPLSLGGNI